MLKNRTFLHQPCIAVIFFVDLFSKINKHRTVFQTIDYSNKQELPQRLWVVIKAESLCNMLWLLISTYHIWGDRCLFPTSMLYTQIFSLQKKTKKHEKKKHLKPCFFILKALKDILQHFKFVNWRIRGFVFLMSRTSYYLPHYQGV